MNPIQKWYEVVETHDLSKLDTLLDENVTFYSPIVYTPQRGKNITKTYLNTHIYNQIIIIFTVALRAHNLIGV